MLEAIVPQRPGRAAGPVDVETLKRAHPIEEVASRYGVELRRQGKAHIGRCPLHADGGRPNLHVWAETNSWWCFRCCVGGDVIRFVELTEGVTFLEAVERLGASNHSGPLPARPARKEPCVPARASSLNERGIEDLVALDAATSLYRRRLLTDAPALGYLEQRGLDRAVVQAFHLGYAEGNELVPYLRWRSLPLTAALRVGLLDAAGREFFAGRIVVPEIRAGRPVWLVGRLLDGIDQRTGHDEPASPKYLGLRGSRPLLGLEQARHSPSVVATEGVFDYLTLRTWGYPAVALMGTHASREVLDQLREFPRIFLVLDQDDAGLEATLRLATELDPSAIPVALPDGVKDLAELACRTDGQAVFALALLEAAGATAPDT